MLQLKDKKILVTGGSGMIGRHLVSLLQEKECDVYVADLNKPVHMENITYKKVDLTNYDSCVDVCDGMDIVFNLVGIKASPKIIEERPADIMTPMLQFNTNMMGAAMKNDVDWYLYTSTVGVYPPADVFVEDDVWKGFPSKLDWFGGWAKRMGELQADAYTKQNGKSNVSIVRPANVYGEYDNFDPKSSMVVPSLIRKAYENDVVSVWGDGSPIRDFIYAGDVARGMLHMVENQVTEPVNLGSGTGVTIKELAETIVSEFGKKMIWDKDKPMGDMIRLFDTKRAESYGFKPSVSLKTGISNTVKWFLDNVNIIDEKYSVFDE
jgi:GDP-L-fucose synthase